MKYANKIPLLFLWILLPFISNQKAENFTTEVPSVNMTLNTNMTLYLNATGENSDTGQPSSSTKYSSNEIKSTLNISLPSDPLLNIVEKRLSLKLNDSIFESLNSTLIAKPSIKVENVVESNISSTEFNDSMALIHPTNDELRNVSESSDSNNQTTPSPVEKELRSSENKTSEDLKSSETNHFKMFLPFIPDANPRLGVWELPYEVLKPDTEGSDIKKTASLIESRSFITNPEISTLRINLALPETRNNPKIESRYTREGDPRSPYYNEEPHSSEESGEPGVHTETSEDYGRFLEHDYRKEIEQEAEAFVKRQKALNATKGDRPDSEENEHPVSQGKKYQGSTENQYHNSAEKQHPGTTEDQYSDSIENQHPGSPENQYHGSTENQYHGSTGNQYQGSTGNQYHGSTGNQYHGSMENQYHGSVENQYHGSVENQYPESEEHQDPGSIDNKYPENTEYGPEDTEHDSEQDYFENQNDNRQTNMNTHQGYFTSQNGNKVFFYKGKQNSFNIEDVFPVIKFTRSQNQPLFFPESFHWPDVIDPPNSFSPPRTFGPPIHDQETYHTNEEAPKIHSPNKNIDWSHNPEKIEQEPNSHQGNNYQEYVPEKGTEQSYEADEPHSQEYESSDYPHKYQGNGNCQHSPRLESHSHNTGGPPSYDGKGHLKNYEEQSLPYDSNIIRETPKYDDRKKFQISQYKVQQKFREELREKTSSYRNPLPKPPHNFHREPYTKMSQEQTPSTESYNDGPYNNKEIYNPSPRRNLNFRSAKNFPPHHHSSFPSPSQNKNLELFQHQTKQLEPPKIPRTTSGNVHFPSHSQNVPLIPFSHQDAILFTDQNSNSISNRNTDIIYSQKQNPDVGFTIHFHPIQNTTKTATDLNEERGFHAYKNKQFGDNHNHLEYPRSVTRAAKFVAKEGLANKNNIHSIPITIRMVPLASSEHEIKETAVKKSNKNPKQKSSVKRSRARRRNGRKNQTIKRTRRQRKTRRSTRDQMKAEAATNEWENLKDKNEFFMYVNNPHQDAYEYGYRVGGPAQTLERHHRTKGTRSTIKLNWEDQNGDSGDQYWEFNHTQDQVPDKTS